MRYLIIWCTQLHTKADNTQQVRLVQAKVNENFYWEKKKNLCLTFTRHLETGKMLFNAIRYNVELNLGTYISTFFGTSGKVKKKKVYTV